MAEKPKHKMTIEERAKQFMPFSPLSGLGRALAKKEKEKTKVTRKELSDDKKNEINIGISLLSGAHNAVIKYYRNGEYLEFKGKAERILNDRKIIVTKDGEIKFSDISDVIIK